MSCVEINKIIPKFFFLATDKMPMQGFGLIFLYSEVPRIGPPSKALKSGLNRKLVLMLRSIDTEKRYLGLKNVVSVAGWS